METKTKIGTLFIATFILLFSTTNQTSAATYNLDSFMSSLPGYMAQFKAGDKPCSYSYQPGRSKPDLYGVTDMVYLLYALDMLDMPDNDRQSCVALIQSFQNEKTGWFGGNVTLHSKEHATAYAVGALKLLGAKPLFPLSFIKKYDTPEKIDKMLEGIPWGAIWSGSHIASGIASAPMTTGEIDDKWLDTYFAWLDREADPATGYWIRGDAKNKPAPTKDEMGGAFHFYYLYTYTRRPLPYPEKIIDATVAIQHENGLWDADIPYCIDLDGVFAIIRAERQTNGYRHADAEASVEKALAAITSRLNDPEFLKKSYRDSHKLVGAIVALAEIQDFLLGKLVTKKPLKKSLDVVPFI